MREPGDELTAFQVLKGLDYKAHATGSVHPEIANIFTKQAIRAKQPADTAPTFATTGEPTNVLPTDIGLAIVMHKTTIFERAGTQIPEDVTDAFYAAKQQHAACDSIKKIFAELVPNVETSIKVTLHPVHNKGKSESAMAMLYVTATPPSMTPLQYLRALRIAAVKADKGTAPKSTQNAAATAPPFADAATTAAATTTQPKGDAGNSAKTGVAASTTPAQYILRFA